jgi:hypothetical protein
MPATPGNFYVDRVLTGVAAGFADGNLVADQIMPVVPHTQQTGDVFDIDPDRQFLIPRDNVRGPGGEPNRLDYDDPDTSRFFCKDHSLEGFLPDEILQQVDAEAMGALPTMNRLVYNILLKREVEAAALVNALSQAASPSTKWDATSGSAIGDIKARKETIRLAVGVEPNTLVISPAVLDKISETADFRDRAKFTMTPRQLETLGYADQLAACIGVPRVLVAGAYYNSGRRGAAATMASVWGQTVFLGFCENPRTAANGSQAFGMHVVWNGEGGGVDGGFLVERERIPRRKGDAIYVHNYYDQFTLNPLAGFRFYDVLT